MHLTKHGGYFAKFEKRTLRAIVCTVKQPYELQKHSSTRHSFCISNAFSLCSG